MGDLTKVKKYGGSIVYGVILFLVCAVLFYPRRFELLRIHAPIYSIPLWRYAVLSIGHIVGLSLSYYFAQASGCGVWFRLEYGLNGLLYLLWVFFIVVCKAFFGGLITLFVLFAHTGMLMVEIENYSRRSFRLMIYSFLFLLYTLAVNYCIFMLN